MFRILCGVVSPWSMVALTLQTEIVPQLGPSDLGKSFLLYLMAFFTLSAASSGV